VLAITGVAMIAAGLVLINSTRVFPGLWVLLPVVGTCCLLVAGPRAVLNRSFLSWPPIVWIGLISYPLYLWHWPLLSFAKIITGGIPDGTIRLALVAASVLLAWVTYRLIEWPVRFGSRSRAIVPALATSMVMLFAFGLATNAGAGFINRPINRSDAAHLVDFYDRMRRGGLSGAYRQECDFMDWITEAARDTVDPSCTAPGRDATIFLWGDSFAQALSQGIREQLPAGAALAQVATSACVPAIDHFDTAAPGRRCEKANVYAMQAIARLHPTVVILAQSGTHQLTDWRRLSARALELGAGHVAVVGPSPTWSPSLPRVYAEHHLIDRTDYVRLGLNQDLFTIDREVGSELRGLPHVTYVSLMQGLCRDSACLARVPGEGELDLMALDFGHLTPKGSSHVGRAVFKPVLDRLGVR
jgi:hypothetical protein